MTQNNAKITEKHNGMNLFKISHVRDPKHPKKKSQTKRSVMPNLTFFFIMLVGATVVVNWLFTDDIHTCGKQEHSTASHNHQF